MKLPNFTILPWSETNRKKVLLLYVNFTNPIYQEKISCDTLLLTKITIKNPSIISSIYQIFPPISPGPLSMDISPPQYYYQNYKKIYTMYSTL